MPPSLLAVIEGGNKRESDLPRLWSLRAPSQREDLESVKDLIHPFHQQQHLNSPITLLAATEQEWASPPTERERLKAETINGSEGDAYTPPRFSVNERLVTSHCPPLAKLVHQHETTTYPLINQLLSINNTYLFSSLQTQKRISSLP